MAQVKLLKIANNLPTEHDGTADDLTLLSLAADTINERTGAAGVTIDSVVLKDGGVNLAASSNYQINGTDIVADAAGTATLSNIDALDATTEATIEAAIDTLANLVTVQGLTVTLADAGADAILGWDDTAAAYENLTQAEVLAVIGSASLTAQGVIEIATGAETNTGTDATRAVSPDGLDDWTGSAQVTTLGTIATGVWTGTDVAVPDGGSGRGTSTAYAVVCGGTTSTAAHQSIAGVGTSGQVLTSNGAAALPTFQAAGSANDSETYTNGNAASIVLGDVVYLESGVNDTVELADADTIAHGEQLVGIAAETIGAAASGSIHVTRGKVIASVISAATAGDIYYLSITGTSTNTLTNTAPSGGPALVRIGIAKNATDLIFDPEFIADTTA